MEDMASQSQPVLASNGQTDAETSAAEERLVRACNAVINASAEFGLSSGYCGETLAELCDALDRLMGDS
jgi:hypothetical protein